MKLELVATDHPVCINDVLTKKNLELVEELVRNFEYIIEHQLIQRRYRQRDIDHGKLPEYPPETESIRTSEWKAGPIPSDIWDRRVEITGPASNRKMMINALNSGANCYMADGEDSETPTWENIINGQKNLLDAVRRRITFDGKEKGIYRLHKEIAVLMYRPRGLHLVEKHVLVDGEPVPAMLFDLAVFLANNAHTLLAKGSGPYLYIPKLEGYMEARLVNDILNHAESYLGLPKNSVKVTVLIETFVSTFELDEIIYELRPRIVGLNFGRWDYLFGFIKKLRNHKRFALPGRGLLTMYQELLASPALDMIQTCHRRGIHAMGGMAAQIPSNNEEIDIANGLKVKADKAREVLAGHDGTWVAHPKQVPLAREIFDEGMKTPNQIHNLRDDVLVAMEYFFTVPSGGVTEEDVRQSIRITLRYLSSWLAGVGAAAIDNLMEDVATAEISRSLLWQWLKNEVVLNDGRKMSNSLMKKFVQEETGKLTGEKLKLAAKILRKLVFARNFQEFLTTGAYEYVVSVNEPRLAWLA